MNRKYILAGSATILVTLAMCSPVQAESLYSKGWAYSYWIDNYTDGSSRYVSNDVADITVSAIYFPEYGDGAVRVRGFSHNSKVQNYYYNNVLDNSGTWTVGVNKMAFTTSDNTSNHDITFNVYNTNPGASTTTSSPIWTNAIYDILNLVGFPSNSVAAYVNYLSQAGGGVTVDTSANYRRTVTQSAGSSIFSSTKTELGIENPQSNPDGHVNSQQKGMEALFNFRLNPSTTNYPMSSSVKITYKLTRNSSIGYVTNWYPTTTASLSYSMNSR